MELCALNKKTSKLSSIKATNSWAQITRPNTQQSTKLLFLLLLPFFQLAYLERKIVLFTCTSRTDTNGKFAQTLEEHITAEHVRMAMHR